jgi:DNA polymerase II small subunit/DNA polymerase delta subunit B
MMGSHFFHYENRPKSEFEISEVENFPNQVWVTFDNGNTKAYHCMQLTQLQMLVSSIADYLYGEESEDI